MHLFTDYIEPLTGWLYVNPNWALFITFLISFGESLAIIGSVIPGSVTMTAIGILAGSGVLDIGWTFFAATLGAVAGDSGSYALGYTFSDRLVDMWPFRHYPNWLHYGKDYFTRHGGKSVLIGRFFGPLRSIIPVIAGMMRMNQWHFLLANILSAIGWSILYVTPGVFIGAASHELSAESATRLFIAILVLLVSVWLISQGMKWVFSRASLILQAQLKSAWVWSKRHTRLARFLKKLTPAHEKNHYPTAILLLVFLFCFIISVTILLVVTQSNWITILNNPVYLFLQSLRTQPFDVFFVIISFITNPLSLIIFGAAVALYAIAYRDWRFLRYWISLSLTSVIITWILTQFIHIPKPDSLLSYTQASTFPTITLSTATALFCFFMGYVSTCFRTTTLFILRIILAVLLFLAGLSIIYLGDNWLTSVISAYFIGLTIALAHWIFYRCHIGIHPSKVRRSQVPIVILCGLLLVSSGISYLLDFKSIMQKHSPHLQQYVLTNNAWWNQTQSLLPVYTTNRIGRPIGLFNIQYLGSLSRFESALMEHGWKKQPDSLFQSLLMRAGGKITVRELPLMAQLYLNKKPTLIMTYRSKSAPSLYVLRLWRSNYHLRHHPHPIWLGSITTLDKNRKNKNKQKLIFEPIIPALDGFQVNNITLPKKQVKSLPYALSPNVLMIKEF